MDKEVTEINCCQRFLGWYNKEHKRSYIHQRADTHFPDLKDKLNWDFVAYERHNPREWIGIEVKELPHLKEPFIKYKFRRDLCWKLTQDLKGKGIRGEFNIFPPDVALKRGDRSEFRKVFAEVLYQETPNMNVKDIMDIGPDIADGFPNWRTEKSDVGEYHEWGEDRPCKLQITKVSDSGCKVSSPMSPTPITMYNVPEAHREAFNEVFKLKNDAIQANRQLKLAKEKGAKETILLLACNAFVDEGLIKNLVQNLDRHLISDIDYIYLVDIYNKDRAVRMYPG